MKAAQDAAAAGGYSTQDGKGYDGTGGHGFLLEPIGEVDISGLYPNKGEVSKNLMDVFSGKTKQVGIF